MIRFSVMYSKTSGSTFDWTDRLGPHRVLADKLLTPHGMVRIEIDRGIGALPPGTPAPYHAVGHLFFASVQELESALSATALELIADQRKYYSGESVLQISEVVEV
jgi:uncharacterized protein (TIGR02118 family)